ncbi:hypothetical protein BCR44DRAFT_1234278 [Catenaria anguillulae PL171]|uniref:Uncharacterized protein n=1 Tax=Catenaria anguillulae PL171 TaxID=765915 RepID=A0A1Y2HDF2_9FUNG|nr:hypothetical protein BCR44DRAFT_1234278 [Catenaria anguillulae PL171]
MTKHRLRQPPPQLHCRVCMPPQRTTPRLHALHHGPPLSYPRLLGSQTDALPRLLHRHQLIRLHVARISQPHRHTKLHRPLRHQCQPPNQRQTTQFDAVPAMPLVTFPAQPRTLTPTMFDAIRSLLPTRVKDLRLLSQVQMARVFAVQLYC